MSLQKKPVGSHSIIANQHLALSAKRTGTKEDKGSTMMHVAAAVDENSCLGMKQHRVEKKSSP